MAAVSSWIAATHPNLIIVDVSVEIAVLARLHGVPVLAMAMPGDRNDDAHRLAYGIAAAIIAPWPKAFEPSGWPNRWTDKTYCVGAFSRFDRRKPHPFEADRDRRRVVVLGGTGGTYYTRNELEDSIAATPAWQWEVLGGDPDWVDDPWPHLTAADVVITHAGQNAVAEVAAARRPAIVIPAERPHREQKATATALSQGHFALCCPRWPAAADWTRFARKRSDDGHEPLAVMGTRRRSHQSGRHYRPLRRTIRCPLVKTAVVTLVAGRHEHLARQQLALGCSLVAPDDYIVVTMGDRAAAAHIHNDHPDAQLVDLPLRDGHLPLASARNAGADAALTRGADLVVFLDVDCLPAPELIGRYVEAADIDNRPGRVLCGPVANLPPPPRGGYDLSSLAETALPVQGRPIPQTQEIIESQDFTLFWSLSFALTAASWHTIGGFSDDYLGYGAEDTDFAQRVRATGGCICWVGGAWAYHQHHPKTDPPVEHLHDIIRNARIFKNQWGWWPMEGWLTSFEELGLLRRNPATNNWTLDPGQRFAHRIE